MKRLLMSLMTARLLVSVTALAANWVVVGKDAKGREFFVDVSSIRVAGEIRRAWTKSVDPPHTDKGTGEDANKWVTDNVARMAFNCGEETTRFEAMTIYYVDGTNWTAPAEHYPGPWQPVPPDIVVSVVMQFICAWKPT